MQRNGHVLDNSLTPEQEAALCDRLVAAEQTLLALLEDRVPAAEWPEDLADGEKREEKGRRIDALRDCFGETDDDLPSDIAALWAEVSDLRWQLALSAHDQVRYQVRRRSYRRVSQQELEQVGLMGLYEGACRFEPSKGNRFSTYARWWVRAAMGEIVGQLEFSVRMPRAAQRDMRTLTDAEPRGSLRRQGALKAVRDAVSLDAPRRDGHAWRETIAGDAESPERSALRRELLHHLSNARRSGRLTERHEHILRRRYQDARRPPAYRIIGEELSVSGERVRQLEKQAVKRLREEMASGRAAMPAAAK